MAPCSLHWWARMLQDHKARATSVSHKPPSILTLHVSLVLRACVWLAVGCSAPAWTHASTTLFSSVSGLSRQRGGHNGPGIPGRWSPRSEDTGDIKKAKTVDLGSDKGQGTRSYVRQAFKCPAHGSLSCQTHKGKLFRILQTGDPTPWMTSACWLHACIEYLWGIWLQMPLSTQILRTSQGKEVVGKDLSILSNEQWQLPWTLSLH